jgi:hypothetical protein
VTSVRTVGAVFVVAACLSACGRGHASQARSAGVTNPAARLRAVCTGVAREPGLHVLCPTWLPTLSPGRGEGSEFQSQVYSGGVRCGYLVELIAHRADPRGNVPFHIIFGGQCRAFSLEVHGGRWPPHPRFGHALGLVTHKQLRPGQHTAPLEVPRVVQRIKFRGRPALVLSMAPYPDGGINGGHYVLVWNQDRSGYIMSFHYARGDSGKPPRRSDSGALIRAAASMVPIRTSTG